MIALFSSRRLYIAFAITVLAGCSGSQPPIGAPGAMPQVLAIAQQMSGGKSWMLPEASGKSLLYASSTNGNVYVYTYPKGDSVGTLNGFRYPSGECVDTAGNVFIVAGTFGSPYSSTIYEYAHGGSSPINTLSDPGFGAGCSIDPTTGNLAVANTADRSNPYGNYGSAAIYADAQGSPTLYYPTAFRIARCGYDSRGNLYVTVTSGQADEAQLARLPRGGSQFNIISIGTTFYGSLYFVPGVQWDGKHMTVSSNRGFGAPLLVYQLKISGNKAKIVGTTELQTKNNHHGGQTWIDAKGIVSFVYIKGAGYVASWPYPRGGQPSQLIKVIKSNKASLDGITISNAPAHR